MSLSHSQEVAMNALFHAAVFAAAAALSAGVAIPPAHAQPPDSHHDHGSPPPGRPSSGHDHPRSPPGGHHDRGHDRDYRRHHHHDRSSVRLGINLGYWWGYPYVYRPYNYPPYRYYGYYDPYYYRPYRSAPYPAPSYRYYEYSPPPTRSEQRPYSCLQEREYQTTVIVGGREVQAYGTACLQPDGSWLRGPATVVPPD
jgi:hypothetical protein